MLSRVSKRIPVALDAELLTYHGSYAAFIGNISEDGIYAKVAYTKNDNNLNFDTYLNLELKTPSGQELNLNCKKVWSSKNTSNSLIEQVGVKIIDPPQEFRKFISIISP